MSGKKKAAARGDWGKAIVKMATNAKSGDLIIPGRFIDSF